MKKILVIIGLITVFFSGCNNKQAETNERHTTSNNTPSLTITLAPNKPSPPIAQTQNSDQPPVKIDDITFDDQKQVEQLIKSYFNALEKKDYASAWEFTATETKKQYSKSEALKSHWGMESVKLVSMKGYLPASLSITWEVPSNTPTIWFEVKLDIIPNSQSAWDKGINERFVYVLKESDEKWRIRGLTTSP